VSGEQTINQLDDANIKEIMESDESISMLEKTSVRLMPIINEVSQRMVKEKDLPNLPNSHFDSVGSIGSMKKKQFEETDNSQKPSELDMRTLLGYLNQNEWLFLLNIGNIM
jgi:hypothetical protein